MTHHAKAPSAGSTQATGSSRGLFRRALATRAASRGSKGSGAPAARLLGLLAISLIALFATAAPASAAPSATMGAVSEVSYASAKVEGVANGGGVTFSEYLFEYCDDGLDCTKEENWIPGAGGNIGFLNSTDKPVDAKLQGLKGGTKYFVRLKAFDAANPNENGISAPPNPDFTTLPVEQPTIVATDDASEVFSTSAKATGKVKRPANGDPAFDITKCRFEYVTDADFGATGFAGAGTQDCAEPLNNAPNGETTVSAQLTGLQPATTYHLRLAAENGSPTPAAKEAADTFTTAAKVGPPTVIATDDASEVKANAAKLTGKVQRPAGDDPALDTDCRFEYITDAQFLANEGIGDPVFTGASSVDCVENTIKSTGETPVSAHAGVAPDTTYHFRLVAENGGGTDAKDAANTFTTPALILPSFTADPASEVGYTKFRASGTADPGNQGTFPVIEYAPVGTEDWVGTLASHLGYLGPNSPAEDLFVDFPCQYHGGCAGALKPGTTYQYRLGGSLGEVAFITIFSDQPYPEFTTQGTSAPPIVTLDPVSGVTATTAHFSGTVNPNAPAGPLPDEAKPPYKTNWHFECTPECKDVNGNVIGGTVEAEEGSKDISGDAKRLGSNTPYEVKLIATNALGTVETPIETFSTPLIKPTIKAAPGASDGKGGYTIQGTVNPNGSEVTDCRFDWGPNAPQYAFSVDCSPPPGAGSKPVTVEAHLTGLNPGVVYHYNLLATNEAGEEESTDQEFIPTLNPPETCANEQLRKENSSLALPECRAYEMVTPPGKEGFGAGFAGYVGGDRVRYLSGAGNIAKSGSNDYALNNYVAVRSPAGWETIPNLNGSSGSIYDAPSELTPLGKLEFQYPRFFSSDLLSSLWDAHRKNGPVWRNLYLRNPDGAFTFVGSAKGTFEPLREAYWGVDMKPSADLSHVITWAGANNGGDSFPSEWGPGIYEYVGTGMAQPRRVDLDNAGSPISTCFGSNFWYSSSNSFANAISADGRVIVFSAFGGCGGANPPADELWARVNGTTAFDVSASQCDRSAADPGGVCNGPAVKSECVVAVAGNESGPGCRFLRFQAATPDGSRVFFTTTQQLIDADTDQTNDIYACDIPSGNPAPSAEKANHCAAFMQVSGAQSGADVESFLASSENGATALFTAKGALADNEDAFGEKALAGDHNLYVWRTDAAHPSGQTTFVGRLDANDPIGGFGQHPQFTPDGRYLVFTTASRLLETDTDSARDVYRYDTDTGELTRASTNVFGVAGNGEGFDARTAQPVEHHPTTTISNDGQKIVFASDEALSPADGNGEGDVYLWTPGRVSLITTGAVGGGGGVNAIAPSGQDIYFGTAGALTPADGDDVGDVYDARIGGGFSFAQTAPCSGAGGACQSHGPAPAPAPAPVTAQPPADSGNVKPCPKGKVAKGDKCVKKKKPKKHSGKKRHGKKAAHKRGGGK